MTIRMPRRVGEVFLVLASLLFGLVLLEVLLQVRSVWARRQSTTETVGEPLHVVLEEPIVYGLNPAHPDISSQGLRNPEVVVPKPPGLWRILILGDSVTFGTDVRREEAYPAQLQRELQNRVAQPVEVINAGVSGYTPFNQLQYYRSRGRSFGADVVVVGFCMNDVANPRLHWDYTGGSLPSIPTSAIPNAEYDREVVQRRDSLRIRSQLLAALQRRAARLLADETGSAALPVFITGEDPRLTIQVLLDTGSPEWRWLTTMYDALHEAVVADGAQLVVVVFPLEYQLDATYPYLPQENLTDYCRSRSIASLDLLAAFRRQRDDGLFLKDAQDVHDAWHLSVRGHALTAVLLADLLVEPGRQTLPGRQSSQLPVSTMRACEGLPASTARAQ